MDNKIRKQQFKGKFFNEIDQRSAFIFTHKFKKEYLSKLIPSMVQFQFLRPASQCTPRHFTAIKSIEQIDSDTLVLKRDILYKQHLLNSRPYVQDIVIIKRNSNKDQVQYENYCDHGWKKQHKEIFSTGHINMRCELNLLSHQAFKNANMIQLLSASYALKQINAINFLQKFCNSGRDSIENQVEIEEKKKVNVKSFQQTKLASLLELI